MSNSFAIASSGLHAAQQRLDATAHNVANLGTEDAQRLRVEQVENPVTGGVQATTQREPQPGIRVEQEMVNAMEATYAFKAGLKMIQTQNSAIGSLLNERA